MATNPGQAQRTPELRRSRNPPETNVPTTPPAAPSVHDHGEEEEEEEEGEEEDEDETEPNLKYARLTTNLAQIYRNGDSTSAFLASADKMVVGTHNGNIHVLSLPTLQTLRTYQAHQSASVTAISISPYSQSFSTSPQLTTSDRTLDTAPQTPSKSGSNASPRTPRPPVPITPSNLIHIASASIDGHVCVSSLTDPRDVTLRNFKRPIRAVALSPDYKNDRSYLSGGLAGNLILTVGGRQGVKTDANISNVSAAAGSWLGAVGLSSDSGKDTLLHSGEGSINCIAWSHSGNYVAWINEEGIKIMRSNLHLGPDDTQSAWKRIAFIERPNRRIWADMAGAWKAQAQWVDDTALEGLDHPLDNASLKGMIGSPRPVPQHTTTNQANKNSIPQIMPEKLLVGWGDTVWVVKFDTNAVTAKKTKKPQGFTSNTFRFEDGVISGLSLYTPTLLLVLLYRTRADDDTPIDSKLDSTPRGGIRRRLNGLQPDLRLIDLESSDNDEVEVEGLKLSRFERLSADDYHLGTLYIPPAISRLQERGAFSAFSDSFRDMSKNATRLFSSNASVLSGSSGTDKASHSTSQDAKDPIIPVKFKDLPPAFAVPGLKIFIHSPFDCIVAFKRDLSDRLSWFLERKEYKHAWTLLDEHPEILQYNSRPDSRPSTPAKPDQSLGEFFNDDSSSTTTTAQKSRYSNLEQEKARIGDLWIEQLTNNLDWAVAGTTAGRVLGSSPRWEHWVLTFAENNKIDHIAPFLPKHRTKPRLPQFVYELVLGHYISHDRVRLRELLDQWDTDLYDPQSIVSAIESKLGSDEVSQDTIEDGVQGRDWIILQNSLAKVQLLDARPGEALKCFVRTRNSEAAFDVLHEDNVLDAISDDIYNFILVGVSTLQQTRATVSELKALTSEPIRHLVSGALSDLISVSAVVNQLQAQSPKADPYLYLYFEALWNGEVADNGASTSGPASRTASLRRSRFDRINPIEIASRSLLAPHADLAVSMFAEYSRPLLSDLLKSRDSANGIMYNLQHATAECERRHYIPELVHLRAATGQTRSALRLIIDEMQDVPRAIEFAREMDDQGLWNDLLDYSMDKPAFIRGLLSELSVGMGTAEDSAIDPVTLVRRIPDGLKIDGLKHALSRILRESDVQCSIVQGAARVLRGEVFKAMVELQRGRTRGMLIDVPDESEIRPMSSTSSRPASSASRKASSAKNRCSICSTSYIPSAFDEEDAGNQDHLLAFPCGHVVHLICVLDAITTDTNKAQIRDVQNRLGAASGPRDQGDGRGSRSGSVGAKIAHMQMLQGVLGDAACVICQSTRNTIMT